ncbi:conserved hypothetical protein [Halorhabdus tiamatea SARL4B]|uniref:Uncharacterized protein n=1 Tax=Halorhabdus tiamatea SARL4B TaxID=1033806 RepID=S6CUC7_9EURY|nr:conserved hypothetical protein [Halorhabdus tiamatea SARL4B]
MRVAAVLLALLAIVGGSAVVAAQTGSPAPGSTADVSTAGTVNTSTTMWIELGEGGDAHWNVSVVATLPDADAVDSFEELAASFEANESDVLSPTTFRRYVRLADNSTSREMTLTDVGRDAVVVNDTGRLELSFTWRNFGLREGSTVHVADAFTGPEGLWLQGLSADQRLVISVPASFDITSAPKGYTNRTIRWEGPVESFQPGDFEITYNVNLPTTTDPDPTTTTPSGPTTTMPSGPTTIQPTPSTPSTGAGPTQDGEIPSAAIVIVVVVLAVVVVYLFRHGGDLPHSASSDDADGAGETATDEPSTDSGSSRSPTDDASTSETAEVGTAATGVAAGTSADPEAEASDDAPIDRELLSDEEYVEALLERNGGRMKQANIVSETGWSNAKVSQLLSAMAEEDRIEKLRIGRENLISFPDDEDGDG